MKIVVFDPDHVAAMGMLLPAPIGVYTVGEAFTGMVDGEPVFSAGRVGNKVWALMPERSGKHMLAITRATRRLLELNGGRYLEALVEPYYYPAERWMRMLGFEFRFFDPEYMQNVFVRPSCGN